MKLSRMLMLLRAGSAVTRAGASDLHGLALAPVGFAAAAAAPQMASGKRKQGKLGMASSAIVAIAGSDAPAASAGSAALGAAGLRHVWQPLQGALMMLLSATLRLRRGSACARRLDYK
jgi:hypothetical protein